MNKRSIRVIPASMDPTSQWKFGPVRRSDYMPGNRSTKDETVPYVSVKRRNDGKYVVIEKYPKKLQPVTKLSYRHGPMSRMDYSSEVKLRSIRPEWKYAVRQQKVMSDSTDDTTLPPIDLGWESDAKVDSWGNYEHTPKGGDKRIPIFKVKWEAKSKVGSLDNIGFSPQTQRSVSDPTSNRDQRPKRLIRTKPQYGAIGDVGSFGNKYYTPGGAEVVRHPDGFNHVRSKVGSMEYIDHIPRGGGFKILHIPTKWHVDSRVGSLENVHHRPGGGDVIFLQERLQWNARSKVGSLDNITHMPGGGQKKVPHYKLAWKSGAKVGSMDNADHVPGGGLAKVPTHSVHWKSKAKVDNKIKREKMENRMNLSFDSLDSYECEYVEITTQTARF